LDASDSDLKGTSRYTGTTESTNIAPLEEKYDPAGGINPSSSEYKSTDDRSTTGGASGLESGDSDLKGTSRYTGTTDDTNIAPLESTYNPSGGIASNKTSSSQWKPVNDSSDFQTSTGGSSHLGSGDSDLKGDSRYTGTTAGTDIAPLEDNYNPAGGDNKTGSVNERDVNTSGRDTTSSGGPHKEFGSSVKPGTDMSKAQQDIRDPSDPQTDPKEAAAKSNVDDANNSIDTGDNPAKVDGPGPRPIEQVAKEFGGDAGRAKPDSLKKSDRGDDAEDDGDGPQKTSHGEGSGEQYVKSSGLKADGGDFDATKPGAGREADRMLFPNSTLLVWVFDGS
jgi:hypothetical protein